MNVKKRRLETAAAIISIVAYSIYALLFFIVGIMYQSLLEVLQNDPDLADLQDTVFLAQAGASLVIAVCLIIALVCVAMIVISALICKAPKVDENGVPKKRLGLTLTLAIFLGITAINYILSGLIVPAIPILVAFGLLVASMAMKHHAVSDTRSAAFANADYAQPASNRLDEIVRLKNSGVLTEEQFNDLLDRMTDSGDFGLSGTFDEKIAVLKKYRDLGLFSEEQYKKAVNSLVDKL